MSVSIVHANKFYNKGKQNEIHVINDISLELPESGLVAVFGVSGCGKTTLLNAIGGLDDIDGGSIELFGENINSSPDVLRNKYIGYIFQNYNLNDNDTVYENVASSLRLCGMTDEEEIKRRVIVSLESVGMEKYKNRTPDTLSGGQMQRVAIARAIVKSPAVILADEPTGNLDETNTVLVMDMLKAISRDHLVILVTHEKELVDFYCDKVIELVDGRIVSTRDNYGAEGYVQKNKNDIYLGELEHGSFSAGGISVESYGSIEGVKLRIVNHNGRLYLKCDTPSVSIIDDSSETRLVEGTFETKARANTVSDSFDTSSLGAFEGKNYGQLFRLFPSLKDSIVSFYTSRKKKGRRFLRLSLIMLAIVFVFMASFTATGIKEYFDVRNEVNENEFLIDAAAADDYSFLTGHIGEHGIESFRYTKKNEFRYFVFNSGAFVTASRVYLEASGNFCDVSSLKNGKLLCGRMLENENEIVISSDFADDMLSSSSVSFFAGYDDLIGLRMNDYNCDFIVSGIVEGDEPLVYCDPKAYCNIAVHNYIAYSGVVTVGSTIQYGYYDKYDSYEQDDIVIYGDELKSGEIALMVSEYYTNDIEKGSKVMILGREYTVADVSNDFQYGYYLVMNADDYASLAYSAGKTDDRLKGIFFIDDRWEKPMLAVRSSSPDETERYLRSHISGVITPDDLFDEKISEYMGTVTASLIAVIVVVAIICLCAFFIMRSIFMPRVREVGIYRAIGVGKKNMLFRFGVESFVLTLGTVFIGYLISGFAMSKLSSSPLFESTFYYPLWFALLLLVIITVITVFFGMLPAMNLLRKTPSEILSKYDI